MTRLPWLIRTRFVNLRNSSEGSRNQVFRETFLFYHEIFMFCVFIRIPSSFVQIDHEIFSTVILSLPLFQEGQLSVSGERMCSILVKSLEDKACPVKVFLGKLIALDMTPLA